MTTTEAISTRETTFETYAAAPSARDFVTALGRIYLDAGLPLAAAFEAALADYQSFGTPFACET